MIGIHLWALVDLLNLARMATATLIAIPIATQTVIPPRIAIPFATRDATLVAIPVLA